jgi:hypothetical protein
MPRRRAPRVAGSYNVSGEGADQERQRLGMRGGLPVGRGFLPFGPDAEIRVRRTSLPAPPDQRVRMKWRQFSATGQEPGSAGCALYLCAAAKIKGRAVRFSSGRTSSGSFRTFGARMKAPESGAKRICVLPLL